MARLVFVVAGWAIKPIWRVRRSAAGWKSRPSRAKRRLPSVQRMQPYKTWLARLWADPRSASSARP